MKTNLATWQKAWELLDKRKRREAVVVLVFAIIAAFATAAMVGSVLPFLSVLSNPDQISESALLAWAYEAFGFTTRYGFLVALGAASLFVIVTSTIIQILKTYFLTRFSTMLIHSISHQLFAVYLQQPYEFFLNRHSSDMAKDVLSETQLVVEKFYQPAVQLVTSAITVIAILALLLYIDPLVASISFLALGGVFGGTFAASSRYIKRIGIQRAEANELRYRIANEALVGIKNVKIIGREAGYVERYKTPSHVVANSQVAVMLISQLPKFAVEAVAFSGIVLLCLIFVDPDGFQSDGGLGTLLPLLGVFAFAGQRLMPELHKVYEGIVQLLYGSAAVEIVYREIAKKENLPALSIQQAPAMGLKKDLALEKITYRYPNSEMGGISDISLSIRAGEKIGIIGSTGAGKTTLVDIILGLLRPSEGTLIVDGTTITNDNLRSWQQSLGYVPQEILLTDTTIAENVALGIAPNEIDQSRVEWCAELAKLDTFVKTELPDGYQTFVGERGVRLSGGQRQRIGIARALYLGADLIVFDEATSALDNLTEREVMTAIDSLSGDKTILMIAHRLSTVRECDRILVLDKGTVVGIGTWEELQETNKVFQRLLLRGDNK